MVRITRNSRLYICREESPHHLGVNMTNDEVARVAEHVHSICSSHGPPSILHGNVRKSRLPMMSMSQELLRLCIHVNEYIIFPYFIIIIAK